MNSTFTLEHNHHRLSAVISIVLVLVVATALAVGVLLAVSHHGGTPRPANTVATTPAIDPHNDPLVNRFGRPQVDPKEGPLVNRFERPQVDPQEDPLVSRYGRP